MVSATGSGELLFTPRIGALYGYALVWAMFIAVGFKWFVNHEIGRYTVCSGGSFLDGAATLPGPPRWAIWVIIVPQLIVAVATIAGLAGSSATALVLAFPGDIRIWTVGALVASTLLVTLGRYHTIESVATLLAVGLGLAVIVAAISVGPDLPAIGAGAAPSLPDDVEAAEVLPWLGFMLSGAAGMLWYSYWVQAKGYGAAAMTEPPDLDALEEKDVAHLRGWVRQMTLDNTVAVVGTLALTMAFLVLGAELLRPEGLVPDEDRIADVLGELLGGVWGRAGYWFMILAVFVGFWDTVLSDQDGFGRMFANGTSLTLPGVRVDTDLMRRLYVVLLLTVAPVALYLIVGEPVTLLKLAGAIEAAHIPVVAAIAVFLNRSRLPASLRPPVGFVVGTLGAALFFGAFAGFYVWTLF